MVLLWKKKKIILERIPGNIKESGFEFDKST